MIASLLCPRCKTENASEQSFCQKCGFGLIRTDTLSRGSRTPTRRLQEAQQWVGKTIGEKYRINSILGAREPDSILSPFA